MTVSVRKGIRRLRTSQYKANVIEQLFNVRACQRIIDNINAIYDDALEVMANGAEIRRRLTKAVDAFEQEVSDVLEVLNETQAELLANCNHHDASEALESVCANMLEISRHTVANIIANLIIAIAHPYNHPILFSSEVFGDDTLLTVVQYLQNLERLLERRLRVINFRIGRFFRKTEPLFDKVELIRPKLRREDINDIMTDREIPDDDDVVSGIAKLKDVLLSEEAGMLDAIKTLPTNSAKRFDAGFKQEFKLFLDGRGDPSTPRHQLDELLANIDRSEQSINSACETYCPTLYDFCYCYA